MAIDFKFELKEKGIKNYLSMIKQKFEEKIDIIKDITQNYILLNYNRKDLKPTVLSYSKIELSFGDKYKLNPDCLSISCIIYCSNNDGCTYVYNDCDFNNW